jgi:HEPN domain-containing protein
LKTVKVDKNLYKNYLKKALEFKDAMLQSLSLEKWNATALNAIHAGISANDAVLTKFHGIRSISPKHDDAVKLLRSLMKDEKSKKAANHLSKLIYAKNRSEYEASLFNKTDAYTLTKHTERFFEWIESII